MQSSDERDERRQIRFWQPDTSAVTGMLRVEHEDRTKVSYAEHFIVVVVYAGAFDGWYRGAVRSLVAGGLHFRAAGFAPGERASQLAFALHDALVREDASEIERTTLVAETLAEIVGASPPANGRAPRAVRRARAFLHDALRAKVTLDELAEHAGLDKFHLVRAFRAEVGLAPYEYLTYLRVSRARELLRGGVAAGDVAQRVGFYDQSQLHRHFRRIVGVAPGRYASSFVVRGDRASLPTRQHHPRPRGADAAPSSV